MIRVPYDDRMSVGGALARVLVLLLGVASNAAAQAQNQINIVPSEMGLAVPSRSTTPATGTFVVTSREPNTTFKADVRYLGPSDAWLSVTPRDGTTPAAISVTADGSRLNPGTYVAQVTVTTPTGVGRAGTVYLTVGASGANAVLTASPTSTTFIGTPGLPLLPPQAINVSTP
ncbi:MAG TPA: hypothetical protein VES20_23595, partial [Bryobacteraceae bacterium]|nr:hypothetical protein [Bryobacteraceae bacterium]